MEDKMLQFQPEPGAVSLPFHDDNHYCAILKLKAAIIRPRSVLCQDQFCLFLNGSSSLLTIFLLQDQACCLSFTCLGLGLQPFTFWFPSASF